MVCIYCGSSKLRIINSRSQKRLNQTWRRRHCENCGATFTSLETIDYSRSLVVKTRNGTIEPFIREKLLISILKSCQHRETALLDARGLLDTVLQKITASVAGDRPISLFLIATSTLETLQWFDKAASTHYEAYHRSALAG